ncbi:hypothetical protein [Halobaculum litoreum]|uniref:ATP-binding protein n=1 Tax=Halobaculum litoreum TaxID=3031998 RepID=A0ABD5XSK3_9EURY|nr:hypothetical protein [Halobaculum sp. DT92]
MHPLLRALLALAAAPVVLALAFVLAPDPTGGLPLLAGLVGSAVAVPAAYLTLGRGEA